MIGFMTGCAESHKQGFVCRSPWVVPGTQQHALACRAGQVDMVTSLGPVCLVGCIPNLNEFA